MEVVEKFLLRGVQYEVLPAVILSNQVVPKRKCRTKAFLKHILDS
jgi:hypothetical protein